MQKKVKTISWLPQLLCGFLFSFMMTIFAPIDMYLLNRSDFWFTIGDFLPASLVLFAIVFVAVELVLFLIKKASKPIFYVCLSILFAMTVMLYVQGNYLCQNNTVLEGAAPVWNMQIKWMTIDLVIWIAVLLACLVFVILKPKLFTKLVSFVSAIIICMLSVSMGVSLVAAQQGTSSVRNAYGTAKDIFTLSENGDVLLFMMDTMDTRLFDRVIKEDPEYLEELNDFTYYRNCGGLYCKTNPTLTALFTGFYYKNERPFFVDVDDAFTNNTFFYDLKDQGYTVDLYALLNLCPDTMVEQADNFTIRDSYISDITSFTKVMTKMILYRYAPVAIQPFVYAEYLDNFAALEKKNQLEDGDCPKLDGWFERRLQNTGITIDNSRTFFKYYGRQGAHLPTRLNRNGEDVPDGSVDQYEHMLGSIKLLCNYIKQLKEKNVFDKSTVIIFADHGYGLVCNPTVLIKYPNERQDELTLSTAPVSLIDLRATILDSIGADYAAYGTPFRLWEGVENRERFMYSYGNKTPSGIDFYMNIIREHAIPSDATDLENYVKTGQIFKKK